MREADRRTIASGVPGIALMDRAGSAVAAAALAMAEGRGCAVLCGPGNNGGDGFVAARRLAAQGVQVGVYLLGSEAALRGDAALARADWSGPVLPAADWCPGGDELIIDALFGTGLTRTLEGEALSLVERLGGAVGPILAVDIASGLDADTGTIRGAAVRATRTVTFAARKPGHLLMPGRALSGPVEVADIGIGPETLGAVAGPLHANGPALFAGSWPHLDAMAHKYDRGHALVLSGGLTQTGAARLAARAALRVGAGLVTVAAPGDALMAHAAQLTAVMLRRCDGADDLEAMLADRRLSAIVLGPALGIGARTRAFVATALASSRPAVLDADALTSFEGEAGALACLVGEATPVVTPHEGEFRRLFAGVPGVLEPASKVERARAAAPLLRAVVVLKGADTVVAAPDGRATINENGSPVLATAGSGDVLAGLIAGLTAQGMRSYEAATAGVWLHAETGRRFGPGLIAEDLPDALPQVLREVVRCP
jgi:ADP-dependent NAD(P)H-hydrate dehydratase / NAD(P)H-hydrate epimerase